MAGITRAGLLGALTQDVRLLDVSDKPAKAKVVREGFQVPPAAIDPAKAGFFLDNLVVVTPTDQPRVVSQSIPAGTRVTAGTVVDLTLAPRNTVPFSIFENIHVELAESPIVRLDPALDDPEVRRALLAAEKPDDLTPADRARVRERLSATDIAIDDSDPARSFDKAFNAARSALAFR